MSVTKPVTLMEMAKLKYEQGVELKRLTEILYNESPLVVVFTETMPDDPVVDRLDDDIKNSDKTFREKYREQLNRNKLK